MWTDSVDLGVVLTLWEMRLIRVKHHVGSNIERPAGTLLPVRGKFVLHELFEWTGMLSVACFYCCVAAPGWSAVTNCRFLFGQPLIILSASCLKPWRMSLATKAPRQRRISSIPAPPFAFSFANLGLWISVPLFLTYIHAKKKVAATLEYSYVRWQQSYSGIRNHFSNFQTTTAVRLVVTLFQFYAVFHYISFMYRGGTAGGGW
jgi:hypothetical protein